MKLLSPRLIGSIMLVMSLTSINAFASNDDSPPKPKEALGQALLAQKCGVCHLRPAFGAKTYGPLLNASTLGGNDVALKTMIFNGGTHMPAFKYALSTQEISAIAAYIKTVPAGASVEPFAMQNKE